MKTVPNDLITTLCRHIPRLLDAVDEKKVRKSLRLTNIVRLLKYQILPKLDKIDKSKQ